MSDIRCAEPGQAIRHVGSGRSHFLSHRKDDNTGWWLVDGSGLDDDVFRNHWEFVDASRAVPLYRGKTDKLPGIDNGQVSLVALPCPPGTEIVVVEVSS